MSETLWLHHHGGCNGIDERVELWLLAAKMLVTVFTSFSLDNMISEGL